MLKLLFIAATAATAATAAAQAPLTLPHSANPLDAYRAVHVPAPNLANSPRFDALITNGVLNLSLHDAIALALENNLDLAIARYNIPIAQADVLRTQAGGIFRGVNTGVVQNTPGGGIGGFGSAVGAGAGGTSGGSGGAGSGASGLVQSTLGTGTNVSSYDPALTGNLNYQSNTQPLSNLSVYGVPTLDSASLNANLGYAQAFPTGTSLQFTYNADRATTNSPFQFLLPELDSNFQFLARQHLLAGFGLGPNLRYLRIARNDQKISDQSFELQVISTITQIANIYWDLVAAYEDNQVKQASLDFANATLASARKQLDLQAIPALDVLKDEAEVANREQDVSIAKSQLQFQSLLIKNALTKNLDDPILEAMPVHPTEKLAADLGETTTNGVPQDQALTGGGTPPQPTEDLVQKALANRIELSEAAIDLQNRTISNAAARNALLPTLDAVAYYGGTGLAGTVAPNATNPSTVPGGLGGAFANTFNNSAPNYYVGLQLNIPIRNRVAKSDQYRSELESRQAELHLQQQRKQIRIEVRNAEYALAQSQARVTAALKARDLAARTFDITGKEQQLGAGSAFQTAEARRDLATADSNLVAARTAYQKAKVELDRATGQTLEANQISIQTARNGTSPN
jgi:outer membrane protein TolC